MVKLKRALGLLGVTSYGIGVIIGAGIYVLIGVAAGLTGNALWMSFLLAAMIAVLTGLSYAELAAMFPKSAAEYIYIKKAYRNEFFAFILGWLIIIVGIVTIATVSLGFSNYFAKIFMQGYEQFAPAVSAVVIAVLAFVNYLGIKESSRLNMTLVAITILGMIFVIALGLPKLGTVDLSIATNGFNGVFAAAALIFFAYLGFEEIVNMSEETKRPRKIIPKALMIAIGVSTLLYILTSISAANLVGWEKLSQSSAPLADAAANSFLGAKASWIVSVAALFTTASVLLGLILVASRMIYGMSREKAFPKVLSTLDKRTKTPAFALLIVAGLAIPFIFYGSLEHIASVTSVGSLIIFTNINIALIWLRYKKPHFRRPFKAPLNIGKFPILAPIGAAMSIFMILQFDYDIISFGIVISAIGAFFYILRKQKIIPI